MDSAIIAAIIGGLSLIGATIATLIIPRILEKNALYERNARQLSLAGHWEGTVHQEVGPEGVPVDIQMALTLKLAGRTVRGEGNHRVPFKNQIITQYNSFVGGFIYDRFLKMEYEGRNGPGQVHFGFALLELSIDGQTLDGYWMGFGALTGKIGLGVAHFHRSGSIPHISAPSQTTI